MITQEILKEKLNYNPDTGCFTWIKSNSPRIAYGSVAGNKSYDGYIRINVNKKLYSAHRLVWLYVYGSFPQYQIDHINGVRFDNRLCNLRESTHTQNQGNQRRPHSKNTSGFLGVYFDKQKNKYVATISINGKNKKLGYFQNPEDAHAKYLQKKRELHDFCTL